MDPRELLTAEEMTLVTRKNNLNGWCIVLFDWAVIIGIFCFTALYPNPLTIFVAITLLGGRQLALGIVVHETGHRTLFQSQILNEFCGKWLAGYWVFSDKETYMKGHLKHHQNAGTEHDPDLSNYRAYPVSRDSIRRKITRDLTGRTGWRRIKSIGRSIWHRKELKPRLRQTLVRSLAVNLAMLIILSICGYPWLYLLWITAFMTTHMLATRVRQIAEHAAVVDSFSPDIRLNTRTIYTSVLERLLIAPHQVNFHMEHHLMPSVPIYRLRKLHDLLLQKGYYDGIDFTRGYYNLLKQVIQPAPEGTPA